MHTLPPERILAQFGVALVASLGGRLNQHWLVDAAGERLVLRRWAGPAEDVAYEIRLLIQVTAMGWPVSAVVAGPMLIDGVWWSLAPFMSGAPPDVSDPVAERRTRGRLLAAFHADLARIAVGQRPGWRRGEDVLADPSLDVLLAAHERADPEEGHLLRWHLERARARAAELSLAERPGQVIHGDFTPWNLRFKDERLSAILDFELARVDHRVAEFALAWRGVYDEVIHGYAEVAPLEPEEWAALTPLWWTSLIDGACQLLRQGRRDDGWTAKMLHRRSPLMGPDAVPYPGR
jgi:aminoglycoside phosphotransferase (APT) family kinase protein